MNCKANDTPGSEINVNIAKIHIIPNKNTIPEKDSNIFIASIGEKFDFPSLLFLRTVCSISTRNTSMYITTLKTITRKIGTRNPPRNGPRSLRKQLYRERKNSNPSFLFTIIVIYQFITLYKVAICHKGTYNPAGSLCVLFSFVIVT